MAVKRAPKIKTGGVIQAARLKSIVERIERLVEERKGIQSDIKDIFTEAKGVGYDVPTVRKVIALRAMDEGDRAEMETLVDTYMHALGEGKKTAVEAMQQGAGTREAARRAGIAVGAASQLRTGVHGIGNDERSEINPGEGAADIAKPVKAQAVAPLGGELSETAVTVPPGSDGGTAENEAASAPVAADSCGERAEPLGASGPALSCTLTTPPSGPQDHSDDAAPQNSAPQPAPNGGVGAGTHSDEETTAAMERARVRLLSLKQARGFA